MPDPAVPAAACHEFRPLRWSLGIPLLLLLLLLLGGCATLPRGTPQVALPLAEDGWLDRATAGLGLAPGESAYRLVDRNRESFGLRMHSAAAAQRSIDAQYYLWNNDLTGRLLAAELLRAAERGVRVRILVDDVGNKGLNRELAALDSHPNLEIRLFNPFRSHASTLANGIEFVLRLGRPNRRMHNKLWLVDGRLAMLGGRNIGDEYFGADQDLNFTDLSVLLLGAAVAPMQADFDVYWNSSMVVPIKALRRRDRTLPEVRQALDWHRTTMLRRDFALSALGTTGPSAEGLRPLFVGLLRGSSVEYVADSPDKAADGMVVLPLLEQRLRTVQRELVLVSPYFVPRRAGVRSFARLREQGITVHVLTNSLAATDVPAVHGGYSKRRRALLRAGVNLYETKPDPLAPMPDRFLFRGRVRTGPPPPAGGSPDAGSGPGSGSGSGSGSGATSNSSLHTKGVVVDDHLAFVGSFNLDPRSARINTENGVFIDDPVFALQVRSHWIRASDPERSYAVRLEGRRLTWTHSVDGQVEVLRHEPRAGRRARFMAWLFRWLPLEGQL